MSLLLLHSCSTSASPFSKSKMPAGFFASLTLHAAAFAVSALVLLNIQGSAIIEAANPFPSPKYTPPPKLDQFTGLLGDLRDLVRHGANEADLRLDHIRLRCEQLEDLFSYYRSRIYHYASNRKHYERKIPTAGPHTQV